MTAQILVMPEGLPHKEALLGAYHAVLRTRWRPTNWDGLYDFLCDLSWLPPGDITIQHRDRPLAAWPKEAGIYDRLIADVNRSWAERPEGLAELDDGSSVPTRRAVRILLPDR